MPDCYHCKRALRRTWFEVVQHSAVSEHWVFCSLVCVARWTFSHALALGRRGLQGLTRALTRRLR